MKFFWTETEKLWEMQKNLTSIIKKNLFFLLLSFYVIISLASSRYSETSILYFRSGLQASNPRLSYGVQKVILSFLMNHCYCRITTIAYWPLKFTPYKFLMPLLLSLPRTVSLVPWPKCSFSLVHNVFSMYYNKHLTQKALWLY